MKGREVTEVILDLIRLFIIIIAVSALGELAFQIGQWMGHRKKKP
jgi:hypothetical protein